MDNNFVLIEYISELNSIIKNSFHSMRRVKPKCFYVSPNYICFGATSGGIYIFRREPCEYVKIIPTKGGSADLIAVSSDERYLSIANSKGQVFIFENFTESIIEQQTFNEHENQIITCMQWNKNVLFVGDNSGKVSVASLFSALAKTIFQVPSESVMKLDSSIVQIDTYKDYLLVSTMTRTYFCNTERECYIQVGKKMRNGYFGACFCVSKSAVDNINTNFSAQEYCKIYCARPGLRIWEAGLDAKVIMTYQFKESLKNTTLDILVIRSEANATLQERNSEDYTYSTSDEDVMFQKIFSLNEHFIATFHTNILYIFDLISNRLLCRVPVSSTIKDVAFLNDHIYLWTSNLEIHVFSLIKLDSLVLRALFYEQYTLCAEICIKYCDKVMFLLHERKELYLVAALRHKISNEHLLNSLLPIFDEIKELNKKIIERNKNNEVKLIENEDKNIKEQVEKEDDSTDLKKLFKQYLINKTHRTIELPEVNKVFVNLTVSEMYLIFKSFIDYSINEVDESSFKWCQEQFLKQIEKNNCKIDTLNEDCLEFLTDSLISLNQSINLSCPCGYPLPICHKFIPKYHQIIFDVLHTKNLESILKSIPYMMKHRVNFDHNINIALLVQFSDEDVFKEHAAELQYDKWYDVLGYFNKIQKGLCLNCDKRISLEGLLSWTKMSEIVLHSLGGRSTIRILQKFEDEIPKGALSARFYQSCMLAHLFKGDNGDLKVNADTAVAFVDGLQGRSYFNVSYVDPKNIGYISVLMKIKCNKKRIYLGN